MMVYSGNAAAAPHLRLLRRRGWGRMVSASHWRTPLKGLPWVLDNGAFSSYLKGEAFDLARFVKHYGRLLEVASPDFAVVPDLVGQGFDSLRFSLQHVDTMWWDVPSYLAVQDGMTVADVEPVLHFFDGLFVGGTVETNGRGNDFTLSPSRGRSGGWKWLTAPCWVELAHRHKKKCHIGRVGTYHDILHARALGADSIDSTSWAMNDTHDYLVAAMEAKPPRPTYRLSSPAQPPRCDAVELDDDLGLAICQQAPHKGEHRLEPYYLNGSPPILAERGPWRYADLVEPGWWHDGVPA